MAHAPASLKALILQNSPKTVKEGQNYVTLRSATMLYSILGFGSWLEPRYIFAAGQLN